MTRRSRQIMVQAVIWWILDPIMIACCRASPLAASVHQPPARIRPDTEPGPGRPAGWSAGWCSWWPWRHT